MSGLQIMQITHTTLKIMSMWGVSGGESAYLVRSILLNARM